MNADVGVDIQYVPISALKKINFRPLGCNLLVNRNFATPFECVMHLHKLHSYHHQLAPRRHQYHDIQHIHLHDLDHV
jgi:hypothetical protein